MNDCLAPDKPKSSQQIIAGGIVQTNQGKKSQLKAGVKEQALLQRLRKDGIGEIDDDRKL